MSSDYSSDSNESDHHVVFPDIFTLMGSRGVFINKNQMSIFPQESILIQEVTASPVQNPIKKRKEGKRTLFTDSQRSILMHWLKNHQSNPYPTSAEKQELMEKTGLNRDQINVWFTNNRVRHGMSCSSQHHGKSAHVYGHGYKL